MISGIISSYLKVYADSAWLEWGGWGAGVDFMLETL
jgi:hypothetical protein